MESTRTDTGVLGYLRELVEIRDLLKTLWTNTARGSVDFVTVIQLSTSTRSFTHRILAESGIYISEPNENAIRALVYIPHHRDLGIPLFRIILIDTDCVDP